MLKFLTAASFYLALAFGTLGESESESLSNGESTGESSTGESGNSLASNYFRYGFGNLYIGYAINKCSATDLFATSFIYPTCTDDKHVSVSWYSTSDCTDDPSSTLTYNSTSSADFLCSGEDSYVGVSLGSGECTATFYAGIDSCVQYSSLSTSTYASFTCDSSDSASLSIYTSSDCSGTAATSYEYGTSCDFSFTYLVDIYGQIVECSRSLSTTSSGESSSESDSESDGEDGSGSGTTTTSSGGGGGGGLSSSGNMISFKNIFGIFAMIFCLIAKL